MQTVDDCVNLSIHSNMQRVDHAKLKTDIQMEENNSFEMINLCSKENTFYKNGNPDCDTYTQTEEKTFKNTSPIQNVIQNLQDAKARTLALIAKLEEQIKATKCSELETLNYKESQLKALLEVYKTNKISKQDIMYL